VNGPRGLRRGDSAVGIFHKVEPKINVNDSPVVNSQVSSLVWNDADVALFSPQLRLTPKLTASSANNKQEERKTIEVI